MVDFSFIDDEASEASSLFSPGDASSAEVPPHETFHQFQRLPTELQIMIWKSFCPDLSAPTRIFAVRAIFGSLQECPELEQQTRPTRRLLATCMQTRQMALKSFPDVFTLHKQYIVRYDCERDIILLEDNIDNHCGIILQAAAPDIKILGINISYLKRTGPHSVVCHLPGVHTMYLVVCDAAMYGRKLEWTTRPWCLSYRISNAQEESGIGEDFEYLYRWPDRANQCSEARDMIGEWSTRDGRVYERVYKLLNRTIQTWPVVRFQFEQGISRYERLMTRDWSQPEQEWTDESGSDNSSVGEYDDHDSFIDDDDDLHDDDEDEDEDDEDDTDDDQDVDNGYFTHASHANGPVDQYDDEEGGTDLDNSLELNAEQDSHPGQTSRTLAGDSAQGDGHDFAEANFSSPEPEDHVIQNTNNLVVSQVVNGSKRGRQIVLESDSDGEADDDADDIVRPPSKKRRHQQQIIVDDDDDNEEEEGEEEEENAEEDSPTNNHKRARKPIIIDSSSEGDNEDDDEEEEEKAPPRRMTLAERLQQNREENPIPDTDSDSEPRDSEDETATLRSRSSDSQIDDDVLEEDEIDDDGNSDDGDDYDNHY